MPNPIPAGHHSVTSTLTFKDSQKAIDFYKKAFNAKALGVFQNLMGPGIMHATIQIGDSILMMGDENPNCKSVEALGGSPTGFFLYVTNVDEAFKQAVAAGAQPEMPVADMFWGDRAGSVRDPFGYTWMIATHMQDLTPEEIRKNAVAFFAQMGKK
jgi:PhnB protein